MKACECKEPHEQRRIVLTGGPGAGKTAVLELIRQSFCEHVRVLPETASILFGGGFPRGDVPPLRRAAQRAIFFTQRELEATAEASDAAIVLCDRGTVDGAAYWPGPDDMWTAVGTTIDEQLQRYTAVVHLRTPHTDAGYNQSNPLRIEEAEGHGTGCALASAVAAGLALGNALDDAVRIATDLVHRALVDRYAVGDSKPVYLGFVAEPPEPDERKKGRPGAHR